MILSLITYSLSPMIKPIFTVYANVSKLPPLLITAGRCLESLALIRTQSTLVKIKPNNHIHQMKFFNLKGIVA